MTSTPGARTDSRPSVKMSTYRLFKFRLGFPQKWCLCCTTEDTASGSVEWRMKWSENFLQGLTWRYSVTSTYGSLGCICMLKALQHLLMKGHENNLSFISLGHKNIQTSVFKYIKRKTDSMVLAFFIKWLFSFYLLQPVRKWDELTNWLTVQWKQFVIYLLIDQLIDDCPGY